MRTFLLLFVMALSAFGQAYHADNRTTTIHTPFRWVVADSAARVGLTVTARDTQKLCFQLADTSIWCLIDNSPLKWAFISGKKVDSLYLRTFQAVTAGITRANVDTSHTRHATTDSATITVFKGTKTFRDSTYFAGGLRGLRLYMQTASVDTFTKGFVVRGNVFGFSQTAGSCPFTSYGTTNKINGYFGTLSNNDGGVICYDSSGTARINLPTRGSGYILGSIAINQTTPDSTLTVGGSAHVTGNARIDGTATATRFSGPLTGNVTGNVSGSSGSCTGNANTATTANAATTATTATNLSGGTVNATTGTFSSTVSGTTFNSGLGATEIPVYANAAFACSLFDNTTYRAVVTAHYQKSGDCVTLSIPYVNGHLSGGYVYLKTIPVAINPENFRYVPAYVVANGSSMIGRAQIGGQYIMLTKSDGTDLDAGSGGLGDGGLTITYLVN